MAVTAPTGSKRCSQCFVSKPLGKFKTVALLAAASDYLTRGGQ